MEIRVAEPSDAAALSAFAIHTYTAAFGDTFSSRDLDAHLEQHLSPESFGRILRQDVVLTGSVTGRLVGYVQFGAAAPDVGGVAAASPDPAMEVRRLYVDRAHQNKGWGGLLMDAALEHPQMKRAACVVLDVWEHNHGAQRFYRRYGFEVAGSRKFTVVSGAPTSLDLIMVLRRNALPPRPPAAKTNEY